jgi:prepilin-type N-terminal cleavage/methylation domain-containing protein
MKKQRNAGAGFTLVEMLVVVAVIAILAAILIPSVGGARKAAQRRKAELECNAIKTAVESFFSDFKYMPWGDPDNAKARVGADQWAENAEDQKNVFALLRGENKLGKSYIEVSSRDSKANAADKEDEGVFYDPWKNLYRIGMDRNLDQQIDYKGKTYKARVLVFSLGPDGEEYGGNGKDDDIRTFDLEK